VGCPARCAFCASGKQGLKRNLSVEEIIEQVVQIDQFLRKKNERVCHIVFMGMGEPFENYDAVLKVISLLNDPKGLNISQRKITVSTVGIVENIVRFADEGLQVNLALSLHAPNQRIRQKIIPYARKYPLEDLLTAMLYFAKKTKRDITYEYTLLSGINDSRENALELAKLLRDHPCTVNLIPYNPIDGIHLNRPEKEQIELFRHILDDGKIPNTCRYTKGKDIAAACGQLALQESN
jgi:23S rRNA (adenine2503-C2)-methyltransferase